MMAKKKAVKKATKKVTTKKVTKKATKKVAKKASIKKLRVLALEPYGGLSHMNFLKGWMNDSVHEWTIVSLTGNQWKWRMRHGAYTLAEQVKEAYAKGKRWDVIFASEMLDLPSFMAFAGEAVTGLPSVICFHENQLTYPDERKDERDLHFALTNLLSAAYATKVVFNSEFHRDSFNEAVRTLVKKAPGKELSDLPAMIEAKTGIVYPGIDPIGAKKGDRDWGPMRILWAARWDHDKNAEDFLIVCRKLQRAGVNFELILVGECFSKRPSAFDKILWEFKRRIIQAGFVEDRAEYGDWLRKADVVISTAIQEFFGMAMVESVDAGAFPQLPDRLAYPEVFDKDAAKKGHDDFFYDGTPEGLFEGLKACQDRLDATGSVWPGNKKRGAAITKKYHWSAQIDQYDQLLVDATKG